MSTGSATEPKGTLDPSNYPSRERELRRVGKEEWRCGEGESSCSTTAVKPTSVIRSKCNKLDTMKISVNSVSYYTNEKENMFKRTKLNY